MEVHLIDTHLLVPWSRASTMVKVNGVGHKFRKVSGFGALVFHKHSLTLYSIDTHFDASTTESF